MAKKEETPEPAEKPEGETPAEEEVSAEKPESETPAEKEVTAEQPEAVQEVPGSKEINKDARLWAMICHLSALAGLVVPVVGCIVGPLIVWQIKKEEFPFVDEQGKEAVNFQISMLIYGVVAALLIFACIGTVLLPAVAIFDLVFMLIAAVKANDGHHYRYPLTIRFIK
ncbi:MAG TPA: DUF4870 domain-containing protein [Sedimentisphaerales bacterium]|jgi:uncharacterized Tic20 family protein|nr:DUF4870 domain-containing protein [Sedimentisphaerales bacterium]